MSNELRQFIFFLSIGAPRFVTRTSALRGVFDNAFSELRPSQICFRFGSQVESSLGSTTLYLRTPPFIFVIPISVEVVAVEVPPLLELDILDINSLVSVTVMSRLVNRTIILDRNTNKQYRVDNWWVSMERHDGRVYVKMGKSISVDYFRNQLQKLHQQIFHFNA